MQFNTRSAAVRQKAAQAGSGRHAQWHNPQTGRTPRQTCGFGEIPAPLRITWGSHYQLVSLVIQIPGEYRNQSLNTPKAHFLINYQIHLLQKVKLDAPVISALWRGRRITTTSSPTKFQLARGHLQDCSWRPSLSVTVIITLLNSKKKVGFLLL